MIYLCTELGLVIPQCWSPQLPFPSMEGSSVGLAGHASNAPGESSEQEGADTVRPCETASR
jgi:hypothetical protein